MKSMIDMARDSLDKIADDGTIEAAIEKGARSALERVVDDLFGYHGQFTKQLKDMAKDALKLDPEDVDFASYNEQMLVAIKLKMGDMFAGQAHEKFLAEMDKVLEPAPKEITLQALATKIAGFWRTEDPFYMDDIDDMLCVQLEEYDSVGSRDPDDWTITFKMQESRGKFDDDNIQLFILKGQIRISHRHTYNPTCFDPAEAFVFKLYAAGTIITEIDDFDQDDGDLYLKDPDY